MINYLKNTEISVRLGINPFNWIWIPSVAYDKPTTMYPKRKTIALAWLGVQLYLDIDDGTSDFSALNKLFHDTMDIFDADETKQDSVKDND